MTRFIRYEKYGPIISQTRKRLKKDDKIYIAGLTLKNQTIFTVTAVGYNWYIVEQAKQGISQWEKIIKI